MRSSSRPDRLGFRSDRETAYLSRLPDLQGRRLRNFAAFLTRVGDGRVQQIWMVDALPAYSDEFWS